LFISYIKILLNEKKKNLALTLCMLSVASLKAQVTIGSTQEPQSGSVLDLSQVDDQKLGFLLPRISLTNVTDWQLRGNSSNGVGMLIYNINPSTTGGNGKAGVYIWTGTGWEPLKSNLSDAVSVDTFNLNPSSGVDIYVGGTESFKVSNFMPANATYPGVTWNITEGTDKASINNTTKTMTDCTVTGLDIGTATLTVTSLDEQTRKTVTINVKACTAAPAAPTGITFSKTAGIKLKEEITAKATPEVMSGGAKPATYNWTIPEDYFEIISGKNDRVITLQAKATVSSITNAIKVNAENLCGKSSDYSNSTSISILNCTDVPATPGTITLSLITVNLNKTFTASVPEVTSGTQIPTSYTWTLPSGLTGSSTTNSIEITGATEGTYAAGTITVTATNACGTSVAQSSSLAVTVAPPACPGYVCTNCAYDYSERYGNTSGDRAKGKKPTQNANDESWSPNVSIENQHYVSSDADLFDAFTPANKHLCVYKMEGSKNGTENWVTAVTACSGTFDSYADWYLPNLRELRALYNALGGSGSSVTSPATVFGNDGAAMNGNYWSSTEHKASEAHTFNFSNGYRSYSTKSNKNYVRCVRRM
jgi:hypothetical protein